jgi:hypothetical protein
MLRVMVDRLVGNDDYQDRLAKADDVSRASDQRLEVFDAEARRVKETVDRLRAVGSVSD